MNGLRVCLLRAPHNYRYGKLDVKEESLLTSLSGFLDKFDVAVGGIYDFHLSRQSPPDLEEISRGSFTDYVVAVRETGNNVHYSLRVARYLAKKTKARVWLYGQTDRLAGHLDEDEIRICPQDELTFLRALLAENNLKLGASCRDSSQVLAKPYVFGLDLEPWQIKRLKGTVETTRGCPFMCSFCFLNAKGIEKVWKLRDTSMIIHEMNQYLDRGVRHFVFHDSEFIGGSIASIQSRSELLDAIITEAPGSSFKVYARADTITKMPSIEKLKNAGLASVFIGVESFFQADLDYFNKNTNTKKIIEAISMLRSEGIFMDLSFILFNRNTTLESLAFNIYLLDALFADGSKYLGMPYFSFSFESDWELKPTSELSDQTYVGWDLKMKSPAASGASFDPRFEPLAELYRLMTYEWSKKLILLNVAMDESGQEDIQKILNWTEKLPVFCIQQMKFLLDQFACKKVSIGNLTEWSAYLFCEFESFNRILPAHLAGLETMDDHASKISYHSQAQRVEEDEYWDDLIPVN